MAFETSPTIYREALEKACEAADRAWEAIEPIYHGSYEVEHKPDGPVTEADRLADEVILETLQGAYPTPEYGYLTEESVDDERRLRSARVWIIDPIDGTRDFIRHNGHFTIHIAMVEQFGDGVWRAVVGLVYQPEERIAFTAIRGEGAWRHEVKECLCGEFGTARRCRVTDCVKLEEARAVTGNVNPDSRLMRLLRTMPLPEPRMMGSLGLKVSLVTEGAAEFYINTGLGKVKEWDTAAPCLVLEEAGGRMSDLRGRALSFNHRDVAHRCGLLASNGRVHDEILENAQRFFEGEGVRLP